MACVDREWLWVGGVLVEEEERSEVGMCVCTYPHSRLWGELFCERLTIMAKSEEGQVAGKQGVFALACTI